ncbi:hypothetical protein EPN54_04275 [bacterium]|nr:MAG: hypothetical protein EPN54_04275 [bacterium]
MVRGCNIKIIAILSIVILTCAINTLNAAWWEKKDIPLPAGAEEARQETRRIGGSELTFTYYATSQENAGSIKSFYRLRLPDLGWKEKELIKDLQQMPNMQVNSGLKNALEQNLMFEKGTDLLIINFMPEGAFNDGKTRFAIARGKMDLKALPSDEKKLMPELLTKPKREVSPVYPDAKLVNLSEEDNSSQASYYTKDDIESVSKFYKEKMPGFGWALAEEKPVKETVNTANNLDMAKYCPNCPKDANLDTASIKTKITELDFSNNKGDSCGIVISSQSSAQAQGSLFGSMTIILVNYEGKKG